MKTRTLIELNLKDCSHVIDRNVEDKSVDFSIRNKDYEIVINIPRGMRWVILLLKEALKEVA